MAKISNNQAVSNDRARKEREQKEREAVQRAEKKRKENEARQLAELASGAKSAPAGSVYATWNSGEENSPVEPFLTAAEIREYAEAHEQYEEGLKELDRNYETKQHENESEEATIETNRMGEKTGARGDFAGRGLFKSSIRDMDLSDIDAAAEIKKKFLSDQLAALAVYNEGQKKSQEAKWHRYEEEMNEKKVQNASEANAEMPRWKIEPHWESTGNTGVSTASTPHSEALKTRSSKINTEAVNTSNGAVTAPASAGTSSSKKTGNSVGSAQTVSKKTAVNVANSKIAGQLYG